MKKKTSESVLLDNLELKESELFMAGKIDNALYIRSIISFIIDGLAQAQTLPSIVEREMHKYRVLSCVNVLLEAL